MVLTFNSSGSNEGFAAWAKQFKEISNCLLIEVDTVNKKFIAKAFTTDKTLIKYSEISFDAAGYNVVSLKDDNNQPLESLDSRIKVGIFMILAKFIDVIGTFTGVEHEMSIDFAENLEKTPAEYHSKSMQFKSKTLKVKVRNSNISEFTELPDEIFNNKVYVADAPVDAVLTSDSVKNLAQISALFKESDTGDVMEFYTRDTDANSKGMFVKDCKNDTYDYLVSDVDATSNNVAVKVFRRMFTMATKGITEDIKVIISSTAANRLLIETADGTTKIVISSVKF